MFSNSNLVTLKKLFLFNQTNATWFLKAFLFTLLLFGGNELAAQTTYNDEFSVVSYGNNDGTGNFDSNWVENDANGGGPTSGHIFVANDRLSFRNLDETDAITRNVNLSAANSISVVINYNAANLFFGELDLQVRRSDGTWYTLTTIRTSSGTTTHTSNIQGNGFLHSNTAFRFTPADNFFGWDSDEVVHINYLRISTDISSGSTDAEIKRPFSPRFSENMNGDFTFIANTTIGTHPTIPYNGEVVMRY